VSIAVDLLSGKRLLDAALTQAESSGSVTFGVGENFPRQATMTMALGVDLLTLEGPEVLRS
jgi:hypothetical protein